MTLNTEPISIKDVDIDTLAIKEKVERGPDCFSRTIVYGTKLLLIETPVLTIPFRMIQRKQPRGLQRFVAVSLENVDSDIKLFREFLETIDHMVACEIEDMDIHGIQQISPLVARKGKQKEDYLRCKVVSNKVMVKCDVFVNGEKYSKQLVNFEDFVKRGQKCQLHLQLNPLWKNKKFFGISYQIKAINFLCEKSEFTKKEPPEHFPLIDEEKCPTSPSPKPKFLTKISYIDSSKSKDKEETDF